MEKLIEIGSFISAIISLITMISLCISHKGTIKDFFMDFKHKVFSIIGILTLIALVSSAILVIMLLTHHVLGVSANIAYNKPLACVLLTISVLAVVAIISIKRSRKQFRTTLNSPNYHNWLIEALKKIYPEWKPLTIENGATMYPGQQLNTINNDFNFNNLSLEKIDSKLCYPENHSKENYINKKKFLNRYRFFDFSLGFRAFVYRVCYYLLVRDSIRYPDLIGYTLDNYEINDDEKIDKINCSIATYYQNVMTSHIMEYELYRLYKNKNIDIDKSDVKDILKYLPYRMNIHEKVREKIKGDQLISEDITKAVFEGGAGRFSLLSVQALIAYYDGKHYRTYIGKRNNNVAIYQGRTQIAPAGGFELYERTKDGYNLDHIIDSFNPITALYREILEELFNYKEFDGESNDDMNTTIETIVNRMKPIQALKNSSIEATLGGIAIDLVYLRHTLSYLIIAKDDIFSKCDTINLSKIEFGEEKADNIIPGCLMKIFDAETNNSKKKDIAMTDTAILAKFFLESDLYKKYSKKR